MNLGYFRAVKDVIKDDAWLGIICDGEWRIFPIYEYSLKNDF